MANVFSGVSNDTNSQASISNAKNQDDISIKVINNTDIGRVQLKFNSTPSEELRNDLKKHGWLWSPKNFAWQRKNTENGLNDAKRIQNTYFNDEKMQDRRQARLSTRYIDTLPDEIKQKIFNELYDGENRNNPDSKDVFFNSRFSDVVESLDQVNRSKILRQANQYLIDEEKNHKIDNNLPVEVRHSENGEKFYCVALDKSYSAGILHISHEWDFMFDETGKLYSASELSIDSSPSEYDEDYLLENEPDLYASVTASIYKYALIEKETERREEMNSMDPFNLQDLQKMSEQVQDEIDAAEMNKDYQESIIQNSATNFVINKLHEAGIDVITDEEEFNRILKNEIDLQKMTVDFDKFKKLSEELKNLNSANDISKKEIEESIDSSQQGQYKELIDTITKLNDENVVPENVFLGLGINGFGQDFSSIIKENGELKLQTPVGRHALSSSDYKDIQPACYKLEGTLTERFIDNLEDYFKKNISKNSLLKTEYEKLLELHGINKENKIFEPRIFKYEGLSYIPVRKFQENEAAFVSDNYTWHGAIIHKPSNGKTYSHDAFYNSVESNADIFYCIERGCLCGIAASGIFSLNNNSISMKERYDKELENFRNDNKNLLEGYSAYFFDTKKDLKLMSEISDVLKKNEVITRNNPGLGSVRVGRGSGIKADGLLHIIVRRMNKKIFHDEDSFDQAFRDTAAIIFCAVNNIDHAAAVKETNGRWAVFQNGIKTIIDKKEYDYYVMSGFDYDRTDKEAAETIAAVNANYGATPEFLEIYAQVGAAYASLHNNITHEAQKSTDETIKVTSLSSSEVRNKVVIDRPSSCIPLLADISKKEVENFGVILVDNMHKVKEVRTISVGTNNRSLFSVKEIFKEAIRTDASGIILFHNHPNGTAYPSDIDRESTSAILKASNEIGIPILDHIIITTENKYYSFLEHGELNEHKDNPIMMISGDKTYGFTHDGKIYLDPLIMNSNAAMHEYTHLWDEYTRRTNQELWNKGKEIFKQTHLWQEVKEDKNYADIANDEDKVLSECHSRICGQIAQRVLERIAEQDGDIAKDKVIDWDEETWKYIKDELIEVYDKNIAHDNPLEREYWDNNELGKTLKEFLATPMNDLMKGKDITLQKDRNEITNEFVDRFMSGKLTNQELDKLSENEYAIYSNRALLQKIKGDFTEENNNQKEKLKQFSENLIKLENQINEINRNSKNHFNEINKEMINELNKKVKEMTDDQLIKLKENGDKRIKEKSNQIIEAELDVINQELNYRNNRKLDARKEIIDSPVNIKSISDYEAELESYADAAGNKYYATYNSELQSLSVWRRINLDGDDRKGVLEGQVTKDTKTIAANHDPKLTELATNLFDAMSDLSAKSQGLFDENKKPDYLENDEPRYYSDDENEPIEEQYAPPEQWTYEKILEGLTESDLHDIREEVRVRNKANDWHITDGDLKSFVEQWQKAEVISDDKERSKTLTRIYFTLEDANYHNENKMLLERKFEGIVKPIELDTQNKSETYEFKPTVGPDGVIDYTAVHADKVYLVNKKDILNKELPSYLPPVEIRRNGSYEIPAIKTGANEYLIKGENTFPGPVYEMSFASKETLKETMTAGKIYKVNLDVLTALTNYHLEYDKALNKAVAARNEESRKLAVIRGERYFEAIKKNSFPNIPKPVNVNDLPTGNAYTTNSPITANRVSLRSAKSSRIDYEPYYFIKVQLEELKREKKNIYSEHKNNLEEIEQKLLDMQLQKADWESTWTKGRETAYGRSNTDSSLFNKYGIFVKRQNGDRISEAEKTELKDVMENVFSVYGDFSKQTKDFGLVLSHAGEKRQHASKATGIFSSYEKAIGVSFEYGKTYASFTGAHEFAHFIDHLEGQKENAWHSSDIPGTKENNLAVIFRKNMQEAKGDYWRRTCECFARAMEEHSGIKFLKKSDPNITEEQMNRYFAGPGYMKCNEYLQKIEPIVNEIIKGYNFEKPEPQHEIKKEEMETVKYAEDDPSQLMLFENQEKYVLTAADPSLTRDVIKTAKMAMRLYTDDVLHGEKTGLWKSFRTFKQHGVFDITGKKVDVAAGKITETGWKQLDAAMNIYRDKRFETARYIFVDSEGNVKDQMAVSSYLPGRTVAQNSRIIDDVIKHADATKTKVVFVHNHPSGNVNPSIEDQTLTAILQKALVSQRDGSNLLAGHVILDHDQFGLYTQEAGWTNKASMQNSDDILEKENKPEWAKEKINSPEQLRLCAENINGMSEWNENWIPVVFSKSDLSVGAVQYYSKDYFIDNSQETILRDLQDTAVMTGTIKAFPVVPNGISYENDLHSSMIRELKAGCFTDICLGRRTSSDLGLEEFAGRNLFDELKKDEIVQRTTVTRTFEVSKNDNTRNDYSIAAEAEAEVKEPEEKYGTKENNMLKEDLEAFLKQVENHDYWYMKSDDTITWNKGIADEKDIIEKEKRLHCDGYFEAYGQFYRNKESKPDIKNYLKDKNILLSESTDIKESGIFTYAKFGYEGSMVKVDVDLRHGIPAMDVVGLADGIVKESRDVIRDASKNSGIELPSERILVSLSPADIRKDDEYYQLPIALSIINAKQNKSNDAVFAIGGLTRSGEIKNVAGIRAAISTATASGINKFIVSKEMESEASFIEGTKVYGANNLQEAVLALNDNSVFKTVEKQEVQIDGKYRETSMESIVADENAMNALVSSIAGRESLILVGSDESGKEKLSSVAEYLQPFNNADKSQSVSRIHSLAGMTIPGQKMMWEAPYRAPDKLASLKGMFGGGPNLRPGEVSLAHNGLLVLNEVQEFRSSVRQAIRIPMKEGKITLSRAGRTTVYPSNFRLIATLTPPLKANVNDKGELNSYLKDKTQNFADNIEIRSFVSTKQEERKTFSIKDLREKISSAQKMQYERQGKLNGELTSQEVNDLYNNFPVRHQQHIDEIVEKNDLKEERRNSLIKTIRTMADLDQRKEISEKDIVAAEKYTVLPIYEVEKFNTIDDFYNEMEGDKEEIVMENEKTNDKPGLGEMQSKEGMSMKTPEEMLKESLQSIGSKVQERTEEEKKDEYQENVKKTFTEAIRSKTAPWLKENDGNIPAPYNPISGEKYQKFSRIWLDLNRELMGSKDPRWLSMSAMQQNNLYPQQGSKSVIITYPKQDENGNYHNAYVHMFNGSQVKDIPPLDHKESNKEVMPKVAIYKPESMSPKDTLRADLTNYMNAQNTHNEYKPHGLARAEDVANYICNAKSGMVFYITRDADITSQKMTERAVQTKSETRESTQSNELGED